MRREKRGGGDWGGFGGFSSEREKEREGGGFPTIFFKKWRIPSISAPVFCAYCESAHAVHVAVSDSLRARRDRETGRLRLVHVGEGAAVGGEGESTGLDRVEGEDK
ncbi:hypothetical protein DM860_009822 [Cuscuta australis]|uniref:Uncharacterized protein n=1 Tax=Cuscuta australis TaxID=267555 RepID=A0A328DCT8_9ASTE|nr:hypothetical protein DM860_009822 [Cuscuta australis]